MDSPISFFFPTAFAGGPVRFEKMPYGPWFPSPEGGELENCGPGGRAHLLAFGLQAPAAVRTELVQEPRKQAEDQDQLWPAAEGREWPVS